MIAGSLVLAGALARCAPAESPLEASALARKDHGRDLVDRAEQSYRRAIELGARDPETFYLLAVILQEHGEVEEAATLLRSSLEREPAYAPAHHRLGQCLLDLGRPAEAVAAFERAVELAPREASFRASLGQALRERGDRAAAEAELERALDADPANAVAHQQLGLLLVSAGRALEAESHLAAVRSSTRHVVADPWLERVQREADTFEKALDRAAAYLDGQRTDDAIDLLSALERDHPKRPAVPLLLGRALARGGQVQPAVDAYVRARNLAPQDADTRAELAAMLLQHGHHEGAEREARAAVELDRDCARAWIVLASLEVERGRPEQALAMLEPLEPEGEALAGVYVVRGEALSRLGRLDDALHAFERAVDLDPSLDYPERRAEETRRALATSRNPS